MSAMLILSLLLVPTCMSFVYFFAWFSLLVNYFLLVHTAKIEKNNSMGGFSSISSLGTSCKHTKHTYTHQTHTHTICSICAFKTNQNNLPHTLSLSILHLRTVTVFSQSLALLSLHKHSVIHSENTLLTLLANAGGTVGSLSAAVCVDSIRVVNVDRGTVSQSVISLVIRGTGYLVQ